MMKSLTTVPNTLKSPTIELTHPRICDFYHSNPSVSPETMNLFLLDLLENVYSIHSSENPLFKSVSHQYQINELMQTVNKIKQTVSVITTKLNRDILLAKTKYLQEFASIWEQTDCVSKRDLLVENNRSFMNQMDRSTLEIRILKGCHQSISEKTTNIIRQFHKILNANIDSILSKSTESAHLVKDFVQNFEMNITNMVQSIQQILFEFISTKETLSKSIIESLQANPSDQTNAVYSKLLYELSDFDHTTQIHLSHQPSSLDNTSFETVLSRLYHTASIQADPDSSLYVLSRDSSPTIAIQTYAYRERNINTDEIRRFLTATREKQMHGILISQYTGITSKPNLYIEIHQSRVILYLHAMDHSPEKIHTAVDIIDAISSKMAEFHFAVDQKYNIPKDILDEINRDYQSFITQKEILLITIKESHKKLIGQIDDMRFVALDKYLSTRYSCCKKQGYICNLCNSFTVSTLKGLAAHKRGCNRKLSGVSLSMKTPVAVEAEYVSMDSKESLTA
jgi:hypothetical protein